jgi:hypothetical protein
MAHEGWMGKWEWTVYLILGKYFYMGQDYSDERCGLWAACWIFIYRAKNIENEQWKVKQCDHDE